MYPVGWFKAQGNASCVACPAGEYQGEEGRISCDQCPDNRIPYNGSELVVHAVATTGSDTCTPCTEFDKNFCASPGDGRCECCDGLYLPPGADAKCEAWPRGVETGPTLADLEAKKKFFRVSEESDEFYRCPGGASACPGGRGAGGDLCGETFTGILCSVCEANHYRSSDGTELLCRHCGTGNKAVAWIVYTAFFLLVCGGLGWLLLADSGRSAVAKYASNQGADRVSETDVLGLTADNLQKAKEALTGGIRGDGQTVSKDTLGQFQDAAAAAAAAAAHVAAAASTGKELYDSLADNVGKLKAIAGFLQILASIPMVFGDTLILPYVYGQLLKAANIFMLGLVDLVPTRCLSTVSDAVFYVRTVLLTTIAPVAFALLLTTAFKLDARARDLTDLQRQQRKDTYIGTFLLFIHLALPLISITSVRTLICDSYDAGPGAKVWFLRVEPSISCTSEVYTGFILPWGILSIAVYPIGVPLTYGVLLWWARHVLNPIGDCDVNDVVLGDHKAILGSVRGKGLSFSASEDAGGPARPDDDDEDDEDDEGEGEDQLGGLDADARRALIRREAFQHMLIKVRDRKIKQQGAGLKTSSFKFLWRDYEPRCYYLEFVEVVRRVFFTALLAAIDPESKLQLALALFVSFIYLEAYTEFRPFLKSDDDTVATIAAWSIVITLMVCFMIRTETSLHDKDLQWVVAVVLLAAALLPMVALGLIFKPVLAKLQKKRRQKQRREREKRGGEDPDDTIEIQIDGVPEGKVVGVLSEAPATSASGTADGPEDAA